jgi:phage gpG-like protein
MSDFSIDIGQFDTGLRSFEAKLQKLPAAMEPASEVLYQLVLGTFKSQSDPWGKPWQPWAPSTAKARARKGDLRLQKLIDTGRLYRSIKKNHTDSSISVSTDVEYADAHLLGTNHIPARPFFPIDSEDHDSFPQEWLNSVFAPIQAELNQ